jgi:hypothetical protein
VGNIDVSDILCDPDFVDNLLLIDRCSKQNNFGENILTESTIVTIGSVQPASGKTIQRLPEALRIGNVTSFWLKGKITVSAPGKYTSVIVFKGQRYQIQMVFDWTNWGAGWCEGTCVAEVPA